MGNILYNPNTPHQHNIQALDDFEDDFDEVPFGLSIIIF